MSSRGTSDKITMTLCKSVSNAERKTAMQFRNVSAQTLASFIAIVAIASALTLCSSNIASATVTPIAYYRLGENDLGAANALPGNNPTIDTVAGLNLTDNADAFYSTNTGVAGRSLSMRFNPTVGSRYSRSPVVTTLQDNYGIEAWVNSAATNGNQLIAYNGNPGNAGFGLFRIGANYQALYGGVAFIGSSPVALNTWTHVAVVRDNGSSQLYVNGAPAGGAALNTPNLPAGAMMIGGNDFNAPEAFDGLIDEVRVFTFTPGQFDPSDLLLDFVGPAVPEPNTFAMCLLALASFGLLARRQRRCR